MKTSRLPSHLLSVRPLRRRFGAFTLLEVMIAMGLFFIASFAVLSLVSSSLNNVRRMQRPLVDASPVLARFAATNSLIEGVYQGSLGDPELLGREYNAYNWRAVILEVGSNHLYSVECVVTAAGGNREEISRLGTLLYRPLSPPGQLDGALGMTGK